MVTSRCGSVLIFSIQNKVDHYPGEPSGQTRGLPLALHVSLFGKRSKFRFGLGVALSVNPILGKVGK